MNELVHTLPAEGCGITAGRSSNGTSTTLLPRWRLLLAELCHPARHLVATPNWRPDPDDEQRKLQHEWRMRQIDERMKQLDNDTEQL